MLDFHRRVTVALFLATVGVLNAQVVVSDGQPYFENFESGPGGWTQTGNIWILGEPAKATLDGAFSGQSAWVTRLTQNYSNNLDVSVQQTFDFTSLSADPKFSLAIQYETELTFDGAVVEMNTGNGFFTVGSLGEGTNWYDTDPVDGLGNSPGWSGSSEGYVEASIELTGAAGQIATVRIRFASDSSFVDEGVAFDDVRITPNLPPPFPGTNDDFRMQIGVDFSALQGGTFATEVLSVVPGAFVEINMHSVGPTFLGRPFGLLATVFDFGTSTVPEVAFDPGLVAAFPSLAPSRLYAVTGGPSSTILLIGTDAGLTPIGVPPLLSPGGATLGFFVPPALAGMDLLLQGVALAPVASNGFFAASNGFVIDG